MNSPNPPASSTRPFAAAPDPSRYFPAASIEEARQRINRSVQRGEGPVLVIGASGLGKSMLLEVVAQQFREEIRPVLLVGGQLCTRRALLQMLLFQLDLPYREMDESELRLSLLSYLQPQGAAAKRILLLVDEADALPPRLLEELRVLTNLSASGQLLVNLVLAGNSNLEEQFAEPKLDLFSQRVAARCYLSAFGREETFQYVSAQVAASGNDPSTLFTQGALEAIFASTDGVPRLVNQLGDQLLWTVAETGYSPLDEMIVQQAWSEIQQLPAPWNTQPNEPVSSPVEFGELAANEGQFEGNDFTQESYSEEFDDDLPASIPISATPPVDEVIVDLTDDPVVDLSSKGARTIDVTEELLVQLQDMDAAQTPTHEVTSVSTAHNPFTETFESEEIVLDRYSTFESLLLAEAPRVANLTDTAFSQQLQQMESLEIQTVDAPSPVSTETIETTNLSIAVEQPAAPTPVDSTATKNPGELLVIEDSTTTQAEVVNGQKFRQLFSSLETGTDQPCFG